MKKGLSLSAFFLITITFISAKSGCSSSDKLDEYYGEWKWVKSYCCGRNTQLINEQSCSCTQSLRLTKNKTYEWRKNNEVIRSGTFNVRKGINDYQYSRGDSALAIQFDTEDAAYISFSKDTLILSRGYMDYSNDYFIR